MKTTILSLLLTWCSAAYCEPYGETLAWAIEDASVVESVPPHLLTAVAWHESRFRPWARSRVAAGPFQLHVASLWGRRSHMECLRPEVTFRSCLWVQALEAAYVLRTEIDRCGSVTGGLAAYNTGTCDDPHGQVYARRVLRVYRRILREHGRAL